MATAWSRTGSGRKRVRKVEILRAENVVKNYAKANVLKGINLAIQEGEFVGIMGKSGSGKTTLLKILGMIENMTDGRLVYKGKEAEKIAEKEKARIRREELGFVFQEFFLMDSLNIIENVMLPLYIGKNADKTGKEKAGQLMEKFGILSLGTKMPNELSGGERQRTAICRALINNPQVIFADEPTGNLDSKSGRIVIEALKNINEELGKTVIMVTHDPQMASYCSRLIFLKDGKILGEEKRMSDQQTFYREILEKMTDL